jgi:hypothetical protein
MSLPPQKNSQAKYANLNLNASLTSKSGLGVGATGSGLAQGASTVTKGGLLVLSKASFNMPNAAFTNIELLAF